MVRQVDLPGEEGLARETPVRLVRSHGSRRLRHLQPVPILEMHARALVGEGARRLAQAVVDSEEETGPGIEGLFRHLVIMVTVIDEAGVLEVEDVVVPRGADVVLVVAVKAHAEGVDPGISQWVLLVQSRFLDLDLGHLHVDISTDLAITLLAADIKKNKYTTKPGYIVNDHRSNTMKVIIQLFFPHHRKRSLKRERTATHTDEAIEFVTSTAHGSTVARAGAANDRNNAGNGAALKADHELIERDASSEQLAKHALAS